jgi:hypothetical protein
MILPGIVVLVAGGVAAAALAATSTATARTAPASPKNRLIVVDESIGPVRLGESRKRLEKALGRGAKIDRFLMSDFGGRLRVAYGDHGVLRAYVTGVGTRWAGFHTRSGLRVGASRQKASSLPGAICGVDFCDHYLRPRHADGPLTDIRTRHRRITWISISHG